MARLLDKRAWRNFDYRLLILVFVIFGIGLWNLRSAAFSSSLGPPGTLAWRQFTWFGIGLLVMIPMTLMDYRIWERLAWPAFGSALLLLLAVLVVGAETAGVKRWFIVSGLALQPSEPCKLALVVMLAKYFQNHPQDFGYGLKDLVVPGFLTGLPAALIILEPDLGTALLYLGLGAAFCLFVGVQRKTLIVVIGILLLALPILWTNLKGYQKQRIVSFVSPRADPLGTGYQIIQSKIAVGSGCFLGKGYLQGTQTQLKFLPQQHTDFVFSVFSEEHGFLGVILVLALFVTLIVWSIQIGAQAKDRFGSLLAFGIAMLFLIQSVFNIGMVVGLLPVVGMPLPFFSYGGSFLITCLAAVGLLLNIRMRRYMF
ncbi:MAG: rod shape-determining protein RodA [Proteobacteria bacterium]|nr:rod shape-determining protein RodA [Pseudomonadota bacterium]